MADYRLETLKREICKLHDICEEDLNRSRLAAFKLSLEAGDDPANFKEELDNMQNSVDAFKAFFEVMDKFMDLEELKLSKLDSILKAVEK